VFPARQELDFLHIFMTNIMKWSIIFLVYKLLNTFRKYFAFGVEYSH
jgi:hypothetical protein